MDRVVHNVLQDVLNVMVGTTVLIVVVVIIFHQTEIVI